MKFLLVIASAVILAAAVTLGRGPHNKDPNVLLIDVARVTGAELKA